MNQWDMEGWDEIPGISALVRELSIPPVNPWIEGPFRPLELDEEDLPSVQSRHVPTIMRSKRTTSAERKKEHQPAESKASTSVKRTTPVVIPLRAPRAIRKRHIPVEISKRQPPLFKKLQSSDFSNLKPPVARKLQLDNISDQEVVDLEEDLEDGSSPTEEVILDHISEIKIGCKSVSSRSSKREVDPKASPQICAATKAYPKTGGAPKASPQISATPIASSKTGGVPIKASPQICAATKAYPKTGGVPKANPHISAAPKATRSTGAIPKKSTKKATNPKTFQPDSLRIYANEPTEVEPLPHPTWVQLIPTVEPTEDGSVPEEPAQGWVQLVPRVPNKSNPKSAGSGEPFFFVEPGTVNMTGAAAGDMMDGNEDDPTFTENDTLEEAYLAMVTSQQGESRVSPQFLLPDVVWNWDEGSKKRRRTPTKIVGGYTVTHSSPSSEDDSD